MGQKTGYGEDEEALGDVESPSRMLLQYVHYYCSLIFIIVQIDYVISYSRPSGITSG